MSFSNHHQDVIDSFKGLPSADPKRANRTFSIEKLVDGLVKKYKLDNPIRPEEVIMGHWQELMGVFASKACPERINGNTLKIRAFNSLTHNELHFQKRQLLAKIRSLPACQHIKEIIFFHQ